MNHLGRAKNFASAAFFVFFGIFFVLYLRSIDFHTLQHMHLTWYFALLSILCSITFRFWGAFIWFVLLKGLGADSLNKTELVYVYAKSWLGRYIPGTAPWILGKIYFASKQGISKNKLAVSSLLEAALQIVAALILSFSILPFDERFSAIDNPVKLAMVLALILCVFALIPWVFNTLLSTAHNIIRRRPLPTEHHANTQTLLRGAGLYLIGSIINGLALFFIAKALYTPLSYHDLRYVIGVGAFSGAAGMLAIFVPSGIGVRDVTQFTLLSLLIPSEYALAITVLARIWDILADLIFFSIASAAKRFSKRLYS